MRAWLERHPLVAVTLAASGVLVALMPSVALLIEPDLTDPIGEFSSVGVFLVNLVSTSTLFVPVRGITAVANVLIVTEARDARFPWLIGVAGGVGMAIGELTAYYGGIRIACRRDPECATSTGAGGSPWSGNDPEPDAAMGNADPLCACRHSGSFF